MEMYQTFNMGMGFAVIVSEKDVNEATKILQKFSSADVKVVGRVVDGKGVELPKLKIKF